jgi:hypothetical protein
MPLYFLKPVVWNSLGYKRPSGAKFTSGYPAEYGFGMEEWNAADTSVVMVDGQKMRAFHTQNVANQPLDDYAGDIFVFMIASHAGTQYLVGIAGGATSLLSEMHDQKRREISKGIAGGGDRWKDVWDVPTIRRRYSEDVAQLQQHWSYEAELLANWICPVDLFYWLDEPMPLNASEITGKTKLATMFSITQSITRDAAYRIAAGIRPTVVSQALDNIRAKLRSDEDERRSDIAQIELDKSLAPTTRGALIEARLGQGKFRDGLLRLWNGACSVTGCDMPEILIASHIKPWKESSNRERLDPDNGLLLAATIDKLFDKYLISFEDSGEMLISSRISDVQRGMLGLPSRLRSMPSPKQCHYLAQHREAFERRSS